MSHTLLEPRYSATQAMAISSQYLSRNLLTQWCFRGLLTTPLPPSPMTIERAFNLLALYELRIFTESARSGIDRKIIAWGWRKRLQAVGALQLIAENDGKPAGFYGGVGEVTQTELEAALRSGQLFEFERRDPANPAYWLIGFERKQNASRGKLVWVRNVAAVRSRLGEAMADLLPRTTVTGVAVVNITQAVDAVHRILDDLARDEDCGGRPAEGPVQ